MKHLITLTSITDVSLKVRVLAAFNDDGAIQPILEAINSTLSEVCPLKAEDPEGSKAIVATDPDEASSEIARLEDDGAPPVSERPSRKSASRVPYSQQDPALRARMEAAYADSQAKRKEDEPTRGTGIGRKVWVHDAPNADLRGEYKSLYDLHKAMVAAGVKTKNGTSPTYANLHSIVSRVGAATDYRVKYQDWEFQMMDTIKA